METKVLIIGVDGATWYLFDKLLERGWMPNLLNSVKLGIKGNLSSVIPPLTPCAWTSFLTGLTPENHFVYDFARLNIDNLDYTIVSSLDLNSETFIDLLSDKNKKIISLNIPMTYPPIKLNGQLIGGLLVPTYESLFTYPNDLKTKIETEVGEPWIVKASTRFVPPEENFYQSLSQYSRLLQNRIMISSYLINKYDWDLFQINFQCNDLLQHRFWHYMDHESQYFDEQKFHAIGLNFYNLLDSGIQKLIDNSTKKYGNTLLVMIISDHGFQRAEKYFNLVPLLTRLGLLTLNKKIKLRHKYIKYLGNLYKYLNIRRIYKRTTSPHLRVKLSSMYRRALIDPDSVLIPHGSMWGLLFFKKLLTQSEINRIICQFESIADSDVKLIKNIYTYHTSSSFPNIILEPQQGVIIQNAPYQKYLTRKVNPKTERTGTHSIDGIIILNGKYLNEQYHTLNAQLIDIMPTILYYLGLGIPKNVDGHVLLNIFNEEFRKVHQLNLIEKRGKSKKGEMSVLSGEEQQKLKSHLEDLGYF